MSKRIDRHICFNPRPGEIAMLGKRVCTVVTGHITTRPCCCPHLWTVMVDGVLENIKHYELKPVAQQ